jgi:hypothetical protein
VRKDESVLSESEMRRSESLSLAILKCEVHWEMSWVDVSMWACEGMLWWDVDVLQRDLRREAF